MGLMEDKISRLVTLQRLAFVIAAVRESRGAVDAPSYVTQKLDVVAQSFFFCTKKTHSSPEPNSIVHFRPICSSQQSSMTLETVRFRSSESAVVIARALAL